MPTTGVAARRKRRREPEFLPFCRLLSRTKTEGLASKASRSVSAKEGGTAIISASPPPDDLVRW